ncbi:MAG: TIGR00730 family Rossman fold protein [Cytophagales bacterium]|nr:TIGR00730 family Rossman fold protein [Bernardetiaceae bacterium]MDW8203938.1 TIGR00730 family Rossman fold protein [Cytophagales bacterium]
MKAICVYCGTNNSFNLAYLPIAQAVGQFLARHHIRLIYGGGTTGIAGALADAMLQYGGKVTGIIPNFLLDTEKGHNQINELIVVKSMHERKTKMFEMADGFIALPGGMGTLEELCEMLTWAHLGLHQKPIGLLNVHGFYDKLLDFLDHAVNQGFYKAEHRAMLIHDTHIESLYEKMLLYAPSRKTRIIKDKKST